MRLLLVRNGTKQRRLPESLSQGDTVISNSQQLLTYLFSLQVEPAPHLLSPQLDRLYLRHYKSPTAPLDMHHLTFGINSFLHSVSLIVFTLLLAHLILRISPHHSHHLHSHHLSLPQPFTPDLKLISFTNPFLHSHSFSFPTDFTTSRILTCTVLKGHWRCLFQFLFPATCAR